MILLKEELHTLVTLAADRHGLPADLVRAIIQVESGNDPWAVRFEPAFLSRYIEARPRTFGPCSLETERMNRATSWGLMQIMGQVARERGFTGTFLSALCEPALGIDYGCRQLAWFKGRHIVRWGWPGVVAAYNAGSPRRTGADFVNQAYVDKVLRLTGPLS